MSALPIEPTERDRERFRDITKAMQLGLEYDRLGIDGQYKQGMTETAFRAWWSAERERQLLQSLNQSQGLQLTEWENKYAALANEYQATCAAANDTLERLEKAEAELARLAKQKPVAVIYMNTARQISIKDADGKYFDMSKHVGCRLYFAPVPAVAAPALPEEWPAMLRTGRFIRRESWNPEAFIWFKPGDDRNHSTVMLYTHGKVHAGWIGLHCDHHARDWMYCDDMARALLQSAPQSDKEVRHD